MISSLYMDELTLDDMYSVIEKKRPYQDRFTDTVDLILAAQSEHTIAHEEAALLLKIALAKELRNEIKNLFPFKKQQREINSMWMNLKTKHLRHA